jgi:hypothetical protein
MWISDAWLVGLAATIFGAGYFFGMKAGCVYSERMCARVGINPKWIASLDGRRRAREIMADRDDAANATLRAGLEEFERNGGWAEITLDGEAAKDVFRQIRDAYDEELKARELGAEAWRIGFRPPKPAEET